MRGANMKKTNMEGLLETLSFKTGCMYLTDLHQPRLLPMIQYAVRGLSPEQFSLWEWRDAVNYITGEEHAFQTPEEAATYLANYERNP